MESIKKIFSPMDISPYSLETVQSAGDFFSLQNTQIELFHNEYSRASAVVQDLEVNGFG